jgi:hypothetical protein
MTWDSTRGLYTLSGVYTVAAQPRVTDTIQISGTITPFRESIAPFQAGVAFLHIWGSSQVNSAGFQEDVDYQGTVTPGHHNNYVTIGQLTDCVHLVGQSCGAPVMTGPATFV